MYIGIDLGTSSLKGILLNNGVVLRQATASYPISYPQNGWTEQDPNDWLAALMEVLSELTDGVKQHVKGISFGGQMHGLVVLDKNDNVIRPCILWNDGRTEEQTKYLNETIGKQFLVVHTGNIAFAGLTAPKLLWLWENERENFDRIAKIMLPKDYLAYYLSGVFATDYSDASGTLLLDVEHKRWSDKMCEVCHISQTCLPTLYESYDAIGNIRQEIANRLGLGEVKVVMGAGDNAASAIGTGTIGDGTCNISLGTSGTLFVSSNSFHLPVNNALHSFCHADGGFHYLGCILSAASANQWWIKDILHSGYELPQSVVELLGKNQVFFAPYLSGERCPHNDTSVRGAFVGLSANTTREQMSLAVLEGVSFAFRDCLELCKANGQSITQSTLCGGGAKSGLWRTVLSNILNITLQTPVTEQGVSFGAAILAMVGCGEYRDVSVAVNAIVRKCDSVEPSPAIVELYEERYRQYKRIYPALVSLYR